MSRAFRMVAVAIVCALAGAVAAHLAHGHLNRGRDLVQALIDGYGYSVGRP